MICIKIAAHKVWKTLWIIQPAMWIKNITVHK